MKKLTPQHIFEICSICQYLRLKKGNQFFCRLGHDKPGKGVNLLKQIIDINRNVDIKKPQCHGRQGMVGLPEVVNEVLSKAQNFTRGLIGFSTGCLSKTDLSLVNKLKVYLRAGSTTLELSFRTPMDLFNFELNEASLSKLRKFSKITIHAPWVDIRYFDGSYLTDKVIINLMRLSEILPISGIVFHPDVVDNFNGLEIIPLSILIENMDSRKKFGIKVNEIEWLRDNYNFDFVLDLQHAYEHDHSLVLAHEMISVMGNRINHLHVSGQTKDSIHSPVFQAENKSEICRLLKVVPSVPVILEGSIFANIPASVQREITYVKEQGNPLLK